MKFEQYITENDDLNIKLKISDAPSKDWLKIQEIGTIDDTIKFWIKILKKYGFKFEGKTSGKYKSYRFSKKGQDYRIKDYDIYFSYTSNRFQGDIDLERIYFT